MRNAIGRRVDRDRESLGAMAVQTNDAARATARGLVVHGAWLDQSGLWQGHLALWAETQKPISGKRAQLAAPSKEPTPPRAHGFCAKAEELWSLTDALWRFSRPGVKPRSASQPARLPLWLPSLATRAWPSPELVSAGWAADP